MQRPSKLDDQRDDVKDMLDAGHSKSYVAKQFGVARSTLDHFIDTRLASPGYDFNADNDGYEEIPVVRIELPDAPCHDVLPLGDVHIGAHAHNATRWQEWIDYIANTDHTSLLGTGDFFNAAIKGSVSEVYDETHTVMQARRALTEQLTPLGSDKIDLLMPGNHEDRIYRAVGDDPLAAIADHFGVPYRRGPVIVVYVLNGIEYQFYVRHGTGGGQIGARAGRLEKQARTMIADVYVSGHTHSQLTFPQEVFFLPPGGEQVERRRQYFVSSGSFLNYEEYAARLALAPTKIGAPRIRLYGDRRDVHVTI